MVGDRDAGAVWELDHQPEKTSVFIKEEVNRDASRGDFPKGRSHELDKTTDDPFAAIHPFHCKSTTTESIAIENLESAMGSVGTPTLAPTAVIRATGFVLKYYYATSSCSGVPNSVTTYSLGICFTCATYPYYCSYSLGTAPPAGSIALVGSSYTDSACTLRYSSSTYNLAIACSSGYSYAYSAQVPVVPASVSTR